MQLELALPATAVTAPPEGQNCRGPGMKIVFDAANSIEAHIVLGLLRQQGIEGRVSGEYLQGAMGELPAFGLVKVLVTDEDYEPAARIIADWQGSLLA